MSSIREVTPHIDGRWHGTGPTTETFDPADPAALVARVRSSTAEDVNAAYAAAGRAAAGWAATPVAVRAEILYAAAGLLDERGDGIAVDLVREEGKLLRDARGEVARAAATLRYHAGLAQTPVGAVYPPEGSGLSVSRRHPVGIVAVVTPFNYPILTPAWKIGPAVALGNTVVWKCSELTPVTAAAFMAALADAGLPAGVVNLVIGGPAIGMAVVDGPMDAFTFTGSTSVGERLRVALAPRAVRVQLELGGKNHAIVCDDADPRFAAERIAYGAMSAAGQKCTAIEVALVHADLYEEVADALVDRVGALRAGSGLDAESTLPPLVSDAAAQRVRTAIAAAQQRGATALVGGAAPPKTAGHFVAATVLTGAPADDPILRDEVFGPVVALVRFTDDDEAIRHVNAGPLGLNAGVFGRDASRGLALCDALRVGMVHLNDITGFPPHIPFGGTKGSAFGPLEQGDTVREFFTAARMLHVHPHPSTA